MLFFFFLPQKIATHRVAEVGSTTRPVEVVWSNQPLYQGHLELVSQDLEHTAFKCLQGRILHNSPVPVLSHVHSESILWCSRRLACVSVCTHSIFLNFGYRDFMGGILGELQLLTGRSQGRQHTQGAKTSELLTLTLIRTKYWQQNSV